jgi:hypothetical protein
MSDLATTIDSDLDFEQRIAAAVEERLTAIRVQAAADREKAERRHYFEQCEEGRRLAQGRIITFAMPDFPSPQKIQRELRAERLDMGSHYLIQFSSPEAEQAYDRGLIPLQDGGRAERRYDASLAGD